MKSALACFLAWFDLKAALAVAGFLISIASLYFTWQNRRLTLRQEERRVPVVIPSLTNGFFKRGTDGGKLYALHITITNPTDTNNAISSAELALTYLTPDRLQMTVKLKANEPGAINFVRGQENAILAVPFSIAAHNVVSGWLTFNFPAGVSKGAEIESHRLILTDTHQKQAEVIPNLMQEYRDETAV